MKKTLFAILAVICLLITSSCASENEISFENASGSRSNGSNFTMGQLSYSEDCIYNMFDDGIYEYDTVGKTVTNVADFAKIDENIKQYNSAFAYIPGCIVIASPSADSMEYDEATDTTTVINNLYVTNLKGELKDTIPVEYKKKENGENDEPGIESVYTFFMIDKGWVYGSCSGEKVRYDVNAGEAQLVGSNVCCIAGDYIYFTDTEGRFCRAKEKDLSEKEEMTIFNSGSTDKPVYGDETDNYLYVSADGTILCQKQIFSKADNDNPNDYWKNENWYSFKFGEEPRVLGNGFGGYDKMYYAGGDYYAVNISYGNDEAGQLPQAVQLIKINGETLDEEILFENEATGARMPTVVAEKFIILSGDKTSAKIYNIETKEVINCTL